MPIATVNNIDIYYEQYGQGEPLLLITGYGADHLMWANVLDSLAAKYQVTIIENRDSGLSQQVEHHYTIVDMANDTVALLDYLNIKKTHVVGHSMGGAIAQELALHHPDRIKKLMLYATAAKFDPRACYIIKQRMHLLKAGLSREDEFRVIGLPWCFSLNFFLKENNIIDALKLVNDNPYPMTEAAYLRQFFALISHDTTSRLKKIIADTFVLSLEEDILTPVADGKLLANQIPNAHYHEVKKQAHCFHLEAPQEFIRLVKVFFK
ncbi:MAG: hypothetical protein A3E82_02480 [Gammaproteobacteria bacterium RIFCSPHIGHO2_12_FULL_38_11]|nr:MAG: hypothetical protein A3E82_02480 [Gammaproteobacteria bacterium RIFCSPHIGHO2_12_FULL_38_11]